MAESTRSSRMPRLRSWGSTIASRSDSIERRADAEVCEQCRRDLRDPVDLRLDADGQERDERVASDERAVATAAGVVASAEVGELPALGRRDEDLPCVGVGERRPAAPQRVGVIEDRLVPVRLPDAVDGAEPELLSLSSCDGVVAL